MKANLSGDAWTAASRQPAVHVGVMSIDDPGIGVETDSTPFVFLSYARSERARVRPIRQILLRAGFEVWWDNNLVGGERWRDEIQDQLDRADCVVVVWGRDSVKSDFVRDEASRAAKRRIIVPVLIDECEIPLGLAGWQAVDLVGWNGDPESDEARRLVHAVRARIDETSDAYEPPNARQFSTPLPLWFGLGLLVILFTGGIWFALRPGQTRLSLSPGRVGGSMVLVEGGTLTRPSPGQGWAHLYQMCREAPERWDPEDCSSTTWMRETLSAPSEPVETFLLDRHEVSVEDLAKWLDGAISAGRARIEEGWVVDNDGRAWAKLDQPASQHLPGVSALVQTPHGLLPAPGRDDHAATLVTWQLANAYCRASGGRLPSEAEWEWAARGAGGVRFPWGDGLPTCDEVVLDRILDGHCAPALGPVPVDEGSRDLAWSGVKGLGGGVSEWTADRYVDPDDFPVPDGVDRCVDSTDSSTVGVRECHVYKGGSWAGPLLFARSAGRYTMDTTPSVPELAHTRAIVGTDIGFRCARDVLPTTESP